MHKKGFTIVEIIIVVAILGIFSTIVIASANQARRKGIDSAVINNLTNAKLQAEVFFIRNGESFSNATYGTNICVSYFAYDNTTKSVRGYGEAARDAFGSSSYTYSTAGVQASTATRIACHAGSNYWVMESPLLTSGNWCVDYTGTSKKVNSYLPSGGTKCPSS